MPEKAQPDHTRKCKTCGRFLSIREKLADIHDEEGVICFACYHDSDWEEMQRPGA